MYSTKLSDSLAQCVYMYLCSSCKAATTNIPAANSSFHIQLQKRHKSCTAWCVVCVCAFRSYTSQHVRHRQHCRLKYQLDAIEIVVVMRYLLVRTYDVVLVDPFTDRNFGMGVPNPR